MKGLKCRVWDTKKMQMFPVTSVSFGDDGSALTVVVEPASKGKFYNGLVDGESCVLMLFTGLKDKNKKEVYEGDIIDFWYEEMFFSGTVMGVVEWDEECAGFRIDVPTKGVSVLLARLDIEYSLLEVQGNEYENPGLMDWIEE